MEQDSHSSTDGRRQERLVMLTLAEANQAIAAALASAENMKMKIAVSVCDETGHLVAFQRMDGVSLESIPFALGKAIAAVASRKSSDDKDAVFDPHAVWRVAGAGLPVIARPGGLRSLATPRRSAPSVSPGAQRIKRTSDLPEPALRLWIEEVDRLPSIAGNTT
jgi:uncharacterized protein GlcG (DUF336 family)